MAIVLTDAFQLQRFPESADAFKPPGAIPPAHYAELKSDCSPDQL
jgi:hypothetical protein